MVEVEFEFLVFLAFIIFLLLSFIIVFLLDSRLSKSTSSKRRMTKLLDFKKLLSKRQFSNYILEKYTDLQELYNFDFVIFQELDSIFAINKFDGIGEEPSTIVENVLDELEKQSNNFVLKYIDSYPNEMNRIFGEINTILGGIRGELNSYVYE